MVVTWGNLQFCFPIGNTLGKVPSEDNAVSTPENAFAVVPSSFELPFVLEVAVELGVGMVRGEFQSSFSMRKTLGKVPSEDPAVSPSENAFAVEQSVSELPFVLKEGVDRPVLGEFQSSFSVHFSKLLAVVVEGKWAG